MATCTEYLGTLALESGMIVSEMNRKFYETDWMALESSYSTSSCFSTDEDPSGMFSSWNGASESTFDGEDLTAATEGVGEMIKKGLGAVWSVLKNIATAIATFFKKLPENIKNLVAKIGGKKKSVDDAGSGYSDDDNARDALKAAAKVGDTKKLEAAKTKAEATIKDLEAKVSADADDKKSKAALEKAKENLQDINEKISNAGRDKSNANVGALEKLAANYATALVTLYNNGFAILNFIDIKIAAMPEILKTMSAYKAPKKTETDTHQDSTIGKAAIANLDNIDTELVSKAEALVKDGDRADDLRDQFDDIAKNVSSADKVAALHTARNIIPAKKATEDGEKIAQKCEKEAAAAKKLQDTATISGMDASQPLAKAVTKYAELASRMAAGARTWMKSVQDLTPFMAAVDANFA